MKKTETRLKIEALFEKCLHGHPCIKINSRRLEGVPHIAGTIVPVSLVLSRVFVHGSIAEAARYYGDLTEEQIKDALSFAARFFQLACEA